MPNPDWRFLPIVPELAGLDPIGRAIAGDLLTDSRVVDASFDSHSLAWAEQTSASAHDTFINVELFNSRWLLFQVCAFENPGYVSAQVDFWRNPKVGPYDRILSLPRVAIQSRSECSAAMENLWRDLSSRVGEVLRTVYET